MGYTSNSNLELRYTCTMFTIYIKKKQRTNLFSFIYYILTIYISSCIEMHWNGFCYIWIIIDYLFRTYFQKWRLHEEKHLLMMLIIYDITNLKQISGNIKKLKQNNKITSIDMSFKRHCLKIRALYEAANWLSYELTEINMLIYFFAYFRLWDWTIISYFKDSDCV